MTTTPARHSCTRGPLISAQGINGVGKTYLTNRAIEALDDKPLMLDRFSQRANGRPGLGEALLRSLRESSAGDPFLRGGTPMAEALILLAIKRHDLDTVVPELSSGRAVVEGRSVDTTAVCQALLLHPGDGDAALDTATALLELASSYRPLPDLTILVTDDACEAVGARNGAASAPSPTSRPRSCVRHARSTSGSPPPIRHATGSWTGAASASTRRPS